jgi:hypothetical protein
MLLDRVSVFFDILIHCEIVSRLESLFSCCILTMSHSVATLFPHHALAPILKYPPVYGQYFLTIALLPINDLDQLRVPTRLPSSR